MTKHMIQFGTLHKDEGLTDIRYLKQSDIKRCPHYILVSEHYREDGSCKCNDPEYQKMMIREWGYKKRDFKKAV